MADEDFVTDSYDDLFLAYLEKKRRDDAPDGTALNPYNSERYVVVVFSYEKGNSSIKHVERKKR